MILGLFKRRDPNAAIVDTLYLTIAEAARRPVFYAELGVPDTVEGRFEVLTLHAFLVLRRLDALPPPARDLAQDLVDATFRQFDSALRELGVGDISVPKRMKTMAGAFLGRGKAYEKAFPDDGELAEALARNLFAGADPSSPAVRVMLAYVRAASGVLAQLTFEDIVASRIGFPQPAGPCEGEPS